MSDGIGRSERGSVTATGPRLARVRRSALPAGSSPAGLPARRRWARVAAGAALALLGGWVFAALYMSAGNRVEVLAMAEDVARYETVEEDDLRTVRVAADEVETISVEDRDDIVGRVAATDLVDGSLLSPGQLQDADEPVLELGEARVGAELEPGDAPQGALVGGVDVLIVVRPPANSQPQGQEAEQVQVGGRLLFAGEVDDDTGNRQVSLAVPESQAAVVATAAADDRLSLVVRGG